MIDDAEVVVYQPEVNTVKYILQEYGFGAWRDMKTSYLKTELINEADIMAFEGLTVRVVERGIK